MSPPATRRRVLSGLTAALAAPALAGAPARIVVIGAGFGGIAAARALHAGGCDVTLVEPAERYVACPSSNAVVAGLRDMAGQVFGYEGVARAGIRIVRQRAARVEADARRVRLAEGTPLAYDRLILSPGVGLRFDAIPGYDEAAAERMPHAWKAGPQTERLARQLAALDDGGLVVMSVPDSPYRCPPGPYERASLIAHFLKTRKPRSKLIVLDAKDAFSKQPLFRAAWSTLYPDHLEWVPRSGGGRVHGVDAAGGEVRAEAGRLRAAVACIIPPQRAPEIAALSGLTDAGGWCPVDPVTFESRLMPHVHIIGDACAAGAMPKSAFSANAQAQVCAQGLLDRLAGRTPGSPKLINACYSLIAPGSGISIAGVFEVRDGALASIPAASGISPLEAGPELRAQEAAYGEAWYRGITAQTFG